jgi:hypothetical protein
VNAEFRGWQGKYKPAAPGIDIRETEHIAKHGAKGVGFRRVKQDVRTVNSHSVNPPGPFMT